MTVLTLLKSCSRSAGADFDRGADEFCPLLLASGDLDPVHGPLHGLTGPGVDRLAEKSASLGARSELDLFRLILQRIGKVAEMVGEFLQRRQQVDLPGQRSLHTSVRRAGRLLRLAHAIEEILRFIAEIGHELLPVQHPVMDEQPFLRAVVVQLVEQKLDLRIGDRNSQVVSRDRFNRVGFVQNHHVVFGKNARPLAAERQVRKEQRVIDDEQIRIPGAAPGFEVEAVVVGRALASQAIAVVALRLIPHLPQRAEVETGQAAVGCRLRPLQHAAELLQLLFVGVDCRCPLDGPFQSPQAEVVAPPLHQHGREFQREHGVEKRNVAPDQLLLQTDRVRGNDDPRPLGLFIRPGPLHLRSGRRQDGGDEIRKALPDPGPCFDNEVRLIGNGLRDSFRHLQLLGALLVALQSLRNPPLRSENGSGVELGGH